MLRVHGGKEKYFHDIVGANFRIDSLQAALLCVKMDHLEQYSAGRAANAAYYGTHLSSIKGVGQAEESNCVCQGGDPGIDWNGRGIRILLPAASSHKKHIWNQYTLRVLGPASSRDALKTFLQARQIGCETYYPLPMHRQACFRPADGVIPALPVSERLSGECLSVPIFPELSREQQDTVIGGIADFLSQ